MVTVIKGNGKRAANIEKDPDEEGIVLINDKGGDDGEETKLLIKTIRFSGKCAHPIK